MLQTLYFKFIGADESIYIFSAVGESLGLAFMEPYGRIGVGIGELMASVLILLPRTVWIGGLLTIGLMIGAIAMHLTILGVVVFDDGGQLFIYACLAFLSGAYVLVHDKDVVKSDLGRLKGK